MDLKVDSPMIKGSKWGEKQRELTIVDEQPATRNKILMIINNHSGIHNVTLYWLM